mmetsp:Transcript_21923/g.70585  ORF Transcript_21923/g.70585 Transcript_21923/m.70585 type:complete len:173 (+) Transcript_21923:94-612(+)|eukprot:CAMPEP_0118894158 /NCGR_PEP_ID=MMETSP1166-20130328/3058_1 /TAXON_ID=1104430 /ORGANISM="Chrysoreinhardia sp, Strain CCMP3193" /LENGTH=172 /DNA_ID=CAMNT_0006833043 /DNA_START=114 /DNA_END=632 /DNA_ORIENTATION=-
MLQPPRLKRSPATTFDVQEEASWSLRCQVTRAYARLPFQGSQLLVSGKVVVNDSWEGALDLALDRAEREGSLASFSLEQWLSLKIEQEGSDDDRKRWSSLVESLDNVEEVPPEPLPFDLSVFSQPLVEVETYRSLDDLQVDDDDDQEQEQDDDDDGTLVVPPPPPATNDEDA